MGLQKKSIKILMDKTSYTIDHRWSESTLILTNESQDNQTDPHNHHRKLSKQTENSTLRQGPALWKYCMILCLTFKILFEMAPRNMGNILVQPYHGFCSTFCHFLNSYSFLRVKHNFFYFHWSFLFGCILFFPLPIVIYSNM